MSEKNGIFAVFSDLLKKGGINESIGRRIFVPVDAAERQGRKSNGTRKAARENKGVEITTEPSLRDTK